MRKDFTKMVNPRDIAGERRIITIIIRRTAFN